MPYSIRTLGETLGLVNQIPTKGHRKKHALVVRRLDRVSYSVTVLLKLCNFKPCLWSECKGSMTMPRPHSP
jgi:hypothetical protein